MAAGGWRAAAIVIAVLSAVRVASTYTVFSQTIDEPTHVACGYEWLATEGYALDPEHPPLARILFAAAARIDGGPWREDLGRVARGTELLYRDGHYRRNLVLARIGNLPFFLLGFAAVLVWTRRLFGDAAALLAATFYGAQPQLLAHAGLATTDMAAASTVIAALAAFDLWLAERTWRHAALLGAFIGVGMLSKFSFLIYFPAGALALLVARRGRLVWRHVPIIALIAFALVWGGYKFSLGTLDDARLAMLPPESLRAQAARYASFEGYDWVRPDHLVRYWDYANLAKKHGVHGVDFVDWAKAAGYPSPAAGRRGNTLAGAPPLPRPSLPDRALEPLRGAWQRIVVHVPLPAPNFLAGAEYVSEHSKVGHPAFLLGRYHDQGWWYYFPVVLFFKTPLAFVLLALAGMAMLWRRPITWIPLLMLLAAMTSRINIGVRHVLPVYPVLAIIAACATLALWRRSRAAAVILAGWFFVAGAVAHPDYLPYFHELARRPERIATDSNLDWGQDLLRLGRVVRERRIDHLHISYFGTADWRRHLPMAEELPREQRVRGWVAVSEMQFRFGGPRNRGDFRWLEQFQPVQRVGKSIRLYRVP